MIINSKYRRKTSINNKILCLSTSFFVCPNLVFSTLRQCYPLELSLRGL